MSSNPNQLAFGDVRRKVPLGNRGRFWQDILDRTHDWYRLQGRGRVYPIPNAWAFCPFWQWKNLPEAVRARTGDGGFLKRVKSAPDYVGSVGIWPVMFDAKEFDGASIPLADKFTPRQIEDLNDSFIAGNIYAGFMVLEKRHMKVWWLQADYVYLWHRAVLCNTPGVAKSINFSKLDFNQPSIAHSIRFLGELKGSRFDYAPALIAGYDERFCQ